MSCSKCMYSEEIVNDYEWGHYKCSLLNKKRLGEMTCNKHKQRSDKTHSKTNRSIQVHEPSGMSF